VFTRGPEERFLHTKHRLCHRLPTMLLGQRPCSTIEKKGLRVDIRSVIGYKHAGFIMIDVGSTVTIQLTVSFRDASLSSGTGFFYKHGNQLFLITNWHIASGKNFQTKRVLSSTGGIPDRLQFTLRRGGPQGGRQPITLALYEDAESNQLPQKPIWLEHPDYRHKVDVVAIPIKIAEDAEVQIIDAVNTAPTMLLQVAREVFVLGYPLGIDGGADLPIWKRASIATEPSVFRGGLPQFLIDTATREGMSGAPVVAIADGRLVLEDGRFGAQFAIAGRVYRFVGIYSGRLGDDEMRAQLGIVWHASVIEQIVNRPTLGNNSFF
jgi:hypothetical protein